MPRLDLTPSDPERRLRTMERIHAVNPTTAEVAFRATCAYPVLLPTMLDRPVRGHADPSASKAVRAIAQLVEASTRDRIHPPTLRPCGDVRYDPRILSYPSLDAASLRTLDGRVSVPLRPDDRPKAVPVDRPRRGPSDHIAATHLAARADVERTIAAGKEETCRHGFRLSCAHRVQSVVVDGFPHAFPARRSAPSSTSLTRSGRPSSPLSGRGPFLVGSQYSRHDSSRKYQHSEGATEGGRP